LKTAQNLTSLAALAVWANSSTQYLPIAVTEFLSSADYRLERVC
jgi:hypothetical protein